MLRAKNIKEYAGSPTGSFVFGFIVAIISVLIVHVFLGLYDAFWGATAGGTFVLGLFFAKSLNKKQEEE